MNCRALAGTGDVASPLEPNETLTEPVEVSTSTAGPTLPMPSPATAISPPGRAATADT